MAYTRVVVVGGGGFGGMTLIQSLRKEKLDIILIDRSNHHLFQPLLYQVATASLYPGEIAYPLRHIFGQQANTSVIMGEVVALHKEKKHIELANGDMIDYDYLVLSPGATHSYFGQDHWASLAPGLKTISDALNIREKILMAFETAERMGSLEGGERYVNFVVIGGGPTGVEMAGAIAEVISMVLTENFKKIRREKCHVYLIEASPSILGAYSSALSRRAVKDLKTLGVKVLEGQRVVDVNEDGVQVGETFIPSKNVIWAAGNQAAPVLRTLGVPLDKQGRVIVNQDLTIPEHPEIFVLGDAAHFEVNGVPLPAVATVAIQQGRYLAKVLKHIDRPMTTRPPFVYKNKGSAATIGKGRAIVQLNRTVFQGFIAWVIWAFIHVVYLIGFRNRLRVMFEWIFFYFSGNKGAHIINGYVDPILKKKKQDPQP